MYGTICGLFGAAEPQVQLYIFRFAAEAQMWHQLAVRRTAAYAALTQKCQTDIDDR